MTKIEALWQKLAELRETLSLDLRCYAASKEDCANWRIVIRAGREEIKDTEAQLRQLAGRRS